MLGSGQAPAEGTQPILWRIELPNPSYLFGTIHLADPRLNAFPQSVHKAIKDADLVYTELAMEDAVLRQVQKSMRLPTGSNIARYVTPDLFQRLSAFLEKKGGNIGPYLQLQPWALGMQLMTVERAEAANPFGFMDYQIYQYAKEIGKVVGGLETPQEQAGVFGGLGGPIQTMFLECSLRSAEKYLNQEESLLEELIATYLRGDAETLLADMHKFEFTKEEIALGLNDPEVLQRLFEQGMDPGMMQDRYPGMIPGMEPHQELLEMIQLHGQLVYNLVGSRNTRMVERMVRMLQQSRDKSFLFAVGAAHYPGPTGIIAHLRGRGYRITRLGHNVDASFAAARRKALEERERELDAEKQQLRQEIKELEELGR